ncbi:MAG TPA: double-strand break repair helicase AddA [Acetobacteraceae bacterium]|nr:double-strand break repair helicase AddA [Acetobacteraceae bacterium]
MDGVRGVMDAEAALQRAGVAQGAASDPAVSAFVGASAGSGKTKLLTDRLLRLMLAGNPPERILCLTFTRAAAAEMALRLQRRLGEWVVMPEVKLDRALAELGFVPDAKLGARARKLFAEVLDLPGGMRISTIHAFCQSVLRRFPLEAALSPHFALAADEDRALALEAAEQRVLAEATGRVREAIGRLAPLVGTLSALSRLIDRLAGADAEQGRARGLAPPVLSEALRRAVGARDEPPDRAKARDEAALQTALAVVAERGSAKLAERAAAMLGWLALTPAARRERFGERTDYFLTATGLPRQPRGLVNDVLARDEPAVADALLAEQAHVREILEAEAAERVAAVSADLLAYAVPVLAAYDREKNLAARLDYADLIRHTNRLLVDPGAAWVLYKLDGGLDHLLLDEAQDTAPEQWAIAEVLTAEFFAGLGSREVRRTVFAVGDPKQSIFSFQGADPAGFDRWRALLRERVRAVDETWREPALDVSFRSTEPVLALVDAVFAEGPARAGVVAVGRTLHHDPVRAGQAGAVELWPLAPASEPEAPLPWTVPEENLTRISAASRLASELARWIARETGGEVRLEGRGRALAPGDVLVLVRRRNAFTRALVRALKAAGVPVAGLDRLLLTEEPAVQDLLALCHALLLPEDDLTFANYLASPLGGLTDEDLLALCPGRSGTLAEALAARAGERPEWRAARDFFATLIGRVDYASPHALLAEALGPLGGRARLYARLGVEAAEPVDELLGAALRHAETNVPSLQGFLHWLERAGAEVERQAESPGGPGGGMVRVMTVHGAKGLQAPLVILPDTTGLPPENETLFRGRDPLTGLVLPLYAPNREHRCPAIETLAGQRRQAAIEEHNRLLYVALTRAEDRVVVAGWEMRSQLPETCWYRLVERGFERLEAENVPFAGDWGTEYRRFSMPQRAAPEKEGPAPGLTVAPLPAWTGRAPSWRAPPPPPEPARPSPLAPSRPEGVELGQPPASGSPLALRDPAGRRFRRGALVHAALQHLPAMPAERRAEAARDFFAQQGSALEPEDAAALAEAVLGVLSHPELAPLFGPEGRAEVPLTGLIGDRVVGGLVDRLVVLPDRVLFVDFKTNRRPPATLAGTPPLYLRQLASYRAVLRGVFPDRPVVSALVWTEAVRVDVLPDPLLDQHNPGNEGTNSSPA